jgi:methionyl-tRNA formyltransferase
VWCLRNGETATGFTLHEVTERIDDGPVLHQATMAIDGITESEVLARAIAQSALPTFRLYLEKLVRREPWPRTSVDATQIYRNPVGYRSFPKSGFPL